MTEEIVNTAWMDCRGAGFGFKLQDVNCVSITKVVGESRSTTSIEIGCSHLNRKTKNCGVTGASCPHLHPVSN